MPDHNPEGTDVSSAIAISVVIAAIALGAVFVLVLWLMRTRSKARAADSADLDAIHRYATSRHLTVQRAGPKEAFLATGALAGLPMSLSTSLLPMVSHRGHMAAGPIETLIVARRLPPHLRLLVARPLFDRVEVESPLQRGAYRLSTGDLGFDQAFHCYAETPEQLRAWLDADSLCRLLELKELREIRVADGAISASMIPANWLDRAESSGNWYHVRPLAADPQSLDRAGDVLARLFHNAARLGCGSPPGRTRRVTAI